MLQLRAEFSGERLKCRKRKEIGARMQRRWLSGILICLLLLTALPTGVLAAGAGGKTVAFRIGSSSVSEIHGTENQLLVNITVKPPVRRSAQQNVMFFPGIEFRRKDGKTGVLPVGGQDGQVHGAFPRDNSECIDFRRHGGEASVPDFRDIIGETKLKRCSVVHMIRQSEISKNVFPGNPRYQL